MEVNGSSSAAKRRNPLDIIRCHLTERSGDVQVRAVSKSPEPVENPKRRLSGSNKTVTVVPRTESVETKDDHSRAVSCEFSDDLDKGKMVVTAHVSNTVESAQLTASPAKLVVTADLSDMEEGEIPSTDDELPQLHAINSANDESHGASTDENQNYMEIDIEELLGFPSSDIRSIDDLTRRSRSATPKSDRQLYVPQGKRLLVAKEHAKKAKKKKKEAKMARRIAKLKHKLERSASRKAARSAARAAVRIIIADAPPDRKQVAAQSVVGILEEVATFPEAQKVTSLMWMKYKDHFTHYRDLCILYVQYSKHHNEPVTDMPSKYIPDHLKKYHKDIESVLDDLILMKSL